MENHGEPSFFPSITHITGHNPGRNPIRMSGRQHYLDNLRSFAVMLVILHHTAITYGASGGWYYRESGGDPATSVILTFFCAINQSFFMGLLFFISGYFTPPSFDRKGAARFLGDKLVRLGIPLLVYAFVIGPALVWFLYSRRDISLSGFYLTRVFTLDDVNIGPLWFVEALLIFNFAYAAFRLASPGGMGPRPFPSRRAILFAAILTGIAAFLLRLVWPVGTDILNMQLGYFASYILLFFTGIVAYRSGWLESLPGETVRAWSRTAVAAIAFLPVFFFLGTRLGGGSFEGGPTTQALSYALWEPFVAFGIILWLLTRFRRRLNGTSPLLRAVSDSSYTAYIIHPPVVVGLSLLATGIAAPFFLKFLVVGAAGVAACFGLGFMITRIPGAKRVL